MSIERLTIGEKTTNQGATSGGRLTATEFNELVARVNDLIDNANAVVYCTQEEYDALVTAGTVDDNVTYNIYDE